MASETLDEHRLRRLIEVGASLVSNFELESLLEHVLEVARELTGARYAALGILDAEHRTLERFITSGIDPELHARIGNLPRGRGVLGVLIDNPEPLRLTDVADHPSSHGFPEHHPAMTNFLGVPIMIRRRGLRQPLPDREARRRVQRRRRGGGRRARGLGRDRDRERTVGA